MQPNISIREFMDRQPIVYQQRAHTHTPCMTRAWSAANLRPFSVTSTCTLLVKLIALRSWYKGLVELATARSMGGAGAELCDSMTNGWKNRATGLYVKPQLRKKKSTLVFKGQNFYRTDLARGLGISNVNSDCTEHVNHAKPAIGGSPLVRSCNDMEELGYVNVRKGERCRDSEKRYIQD